MMTARVTEFGDETVVVLSKEMLAQLGVRAGDQVNVRPAIDGSIHAVDGEKKIDQQVEVANRIMEKRRDVLRRLAE